MTARDFVVLATADWDNPYWTNKQHVARELVRQGNRVLYVESVASRRPRLEGRDLARIWRRLVRAFRKPREVVPNLWVWSPTILPFHDLASVRALNRFLLRWSLHFWRKRLGLRSEVLWTYSPITCEILDPDDFELCVYHAVDDIKEQPGMNREFIETAEWKLSKRADLIFTTAHHLQQHHEALNPRTHYFSNVVDYDHFSRALNHPSPPPDIASIPAPRIGFVGAISSYKVDLDLLAAVAAARPDWSFVMIGEVSEGEPLSDISSKIMLDNVHLLGGKPYQDLPAYLSCFDVAVLPNRLNEYTRSMFPMKFYEYLAAGRPIVATALPALSDLKHLFHTATNSADFVNGIEAALAGKAAPLGLRLKEAEKNTYCTRTRAMLALLDGAVSQSRA